MKRFNLDCLSARYGDEYDTIWVNLTYNGITRHICYETKDHIEWDFLDGDSEPDMPHEVREKWWSHWGDELLNRLFYQYAF